MIFATCIYQQQQQNIWILFHFVGRIFEKDTKIVRDQYVLDGD